MISYQHLKQLKELYLLKATGTRYVDPIVIEHSEVQDQEMLPEDITSLHNVISGCHLCDLSKSRSAVQVFHGAADAELMIVSDFPTMAENSEGAYAGKSGKVLRDMIVNVLEIAVEDIYFTHLVKCMPLGGKAPVENEVLSCKPFLQQQIETVNPKLIVALGELSYNYLTNDKSDFGKIKGKILPFHGYNLITIDHPKFLARNPSAKKDTFKDLILIKKFLCDT